MKKRLFRILPFLGMFILATGSVVLSCTTTSIRDDSSIDLNINCSVDSEIFTAWVLKDIQSVIVVDESDHSRKIELTPDEWLYDYDTTELLILREIPFQEYFAKIEGRHTVPHSFVLSGKADDDLLIIIDNRLAIEGYDYSIDTQTNHLVFRTGIDLKNTEWYIRYRTQEGGVGLGEWSAENQDQISYLEAEYQRRFLESWYDKQDSFWFFDNSGTPTEPPNLVKRKATSEELAAMKSYPMSVWKMRLDSDFSELSKEMGFDISLPKEINVDNPSILFKLFSKRIEEYCDNGKLLKRLHVMYENGKVISDNYKLIDIEISLLQRKEEENPDHLIDESAIDLGTPVRRTRQWGIVTQHPDEKPKIKSLTSWSWSNGSVNFNVSGESSYEEIYQVLIHEIIKCY